MTPETGILHCQLLQLQDGAEYALYGSSVRNCDLRLSNPDTPHPQAVDSVRDGTRLPGAVFKYLAHATRLPTTSPHSRRVTNPFSPRVWCSRWLQDLHCRQLDTLRTLHLRSQGETYEHPHENNNIACAKRFQPGWLNRRAVHKERPTSSLTETSPLLAPDVSGARECFSIQVSPAR